MRSLALALAAVALLVARTGGAQARPPLDGPRPTYLPEVAPFDERYGVMPGYEVRQRAHRTLLIAGGSTFAASYFASVLGATAVVASRNPEGPKLAPLFIPGFGPLITITTAGTGPAAPFLVADGVLQLGGAALFVTGLLLPERVLVLKPTPGVTARVGSGPALLSGTF